MTIEPASESVRPWMRALPLLFVVLAKLLLWISFPLIIFVILLWFRSQTVAESVAHHSESGSWSALNARGKLRIERVNGFVNASGWQYQRDDATGPLAAPISNFMTDHGFYDSYRSGQTVGIYVRHSTVVGFIALVPCAYLAICAVKRWRRKPGHCRKCGYDLRASDGPCPECGYDA